MCGDSRHRQWGCRRKCASKWSLVVRRFRVVRLRHPKLELLDLSLQADGPPRAEANPMHASGRHTYEVLETAHFASQHRHRRDGVLLIALLLLEIAPDHNPAERSLAE